METPDKLSQDAKAAREAHMSYGKYMALRYPVTISAPDREPGENEARCKNCGIIFKKTNHFRVVCSDACRSEHYRKNVREWKMKNRHRPEKEDEDGN